MFQGNASELNVARGKNVLSRKPEGVSEQFGETTETIQTGGTKVLFFIFIWVVATTQSWHSGLVTICCHCCIIKTLTATTALEINLSVLLVQCQQIMKNRCNQLSFETETNSYVTIENR